MQRASDLLGAPVLADGKPLGTVKEILVDLDRKRLAALLLDGKGFVEPGLIPVENFELTPDVLLGSAEAVLRGEAAAIQRQGKLTLAGARNLTVLGAAGRCLGQVADLVLDGADIVAVEYSAGLLQDVFAGRNLLSGPWRADVGHGWLAAPAAGGETESGG